MTRVNLYSRDFTFQANLAIPAVGMPRHRKTHSATWLEVRPGEGQAYHVEMTRAVSAESMAKLQVGVVIAVKCDRDDPARVMPEVPVRVVNS